MIDEREESDARGLQEGSQFFHSCVNRMIGGDIGGAADCIRCDESSLTNGVGPFTCSDSRGAAGVRNSVDGGKRVRARR